jgi:hypothetical protein
MLSGYQQAAGLLYINNPLEKSRVWSHSLFQKQSRTSDRAVFRLALRKRTRYDQCVRGGDFTETLQMGIISPVREKVSIAR